MYTATKDRLPFIRKRVSSSAKTNNGHQQGCRLANTSGHLNSSKADVNGIKLTNDNTTGIHQSRHSPMMTVPQMTTTSERLPATATANLNRNTGKRSLSESSADEFPTRRSSETLARNGCNCKMSRNELVINANTADSGSATMAASTGKTQRQQRSSGGKCKYNLSDLIDVGIRVILVIVFCKLEITPAFKRKIQIEEIWLYKNPRSPDYVTPVALLVAVILGPFFTTIIQLLLTGNRRDFRAASWTWTLVLGLNGLATSLLKITVGRPRPDYFYRCFPDGIMVLNNITANMPQNGTLDLFNCTGNPHDINEGHKSFPSGHSSFAFASFSFIAFYVGSKLHAFDARGRGQTWRLLIAITPVAVAALVAISRTCDYHHHWQDVVCGSLIGFFTSYVVYRQYYPSVFAHNCQRPLPRGAYTNIENTEYSRLSDGCGDADTTFETEYSEDYVAAPKDERHPLICDDKDNTKWT